MIDKITVSHEQADELTNRMRELMDRVGAAKKCEYSTGTDRMFNFNEIANTEKISPFKALSVLRAKHRVSIREIVLAIENPHTLPYPQEMLDEKFLDDIQYTMLEYIMASAQNKKNKRKATNEL